MKIGKVIGRVVLSAAVPEYRGGRWLLVAPCGKADLVKAADRPIPRGGPSLVCFDSLGAGTGDWIGYTEGGEAAAPFEKPMPIDAYNCCILDTVGIGSRNLISP